jgi:hypothetical protein
MIKAYCVSGCEDVDSLVEFIKFELKGSPLLTRKLIDILGAVQNGANSSHANGFQLCLVLSELLVSWVERDRAPLYIDKLVTVASNTMDAWKSPTCALHLLTVFEERSVLPLLKNQGKYLLLVSKLCISVNWNETDLNEPEQDETIRNEANLSDALSRGVLPWVCFQKSVGQIY